MKPRIREVLVVEGRYDVNTLRQIIDAVILETRGFSVFKDRELKSLLRFYAETRGIIVLTDSDGAGFLIRGHLRGALPANRVKHAYIPDVPGKEKRKARPSKEGKLGVEGMQPEVLLSALRRAGATFEGEDVSIAGGGTLTKADFYSMGLSGGTNSTEKRRNLALELGFPERMTADGLLDAINTLLLSGRLEKSFFDAYCADHTAQQDS